MHIFERDPITGKKIKKIQCVGCCEFYDINKPHHCKRASEIINWL